MKKILVLALLSLSFASVSASVTSYDDHPKFEATLNVENIQKNYDYTAFPAIDAFAYVTVDSATADELEFKVEKAKAKIENTSDKAIDTSRRIPRARDNVENCKSWLSLYFSASNSKFLSGDSKSISFTEYRSIKTINTLGLLVSDAPRI